ncbi:MAG TPA: glycerol-3-phosphate acyltransferase, partial [Solirubrobacteraceae bacterium]|nr:glycerol-3-phosphate acyltransferase [Solirubrobacteraceae bacterium]
RAHGVDLYATGDGHPGAWNALEQLGGRRAWPAFIGDALKGLLGGVAGWLLAGAAGAYTGVAAAMAGHAFPVFARLRGGKAVMTFVGGAFALAPIPATLCLVVCATLGRAHSFALGARVGVAAFPVAQLVFQGVERVIATGGLMCLIGALFLLRRRSVPARSASGAAPTS